MHRTKRMQNGSLLPDLHFLSSLQTFSMPDNEILVLCQPFLIAKKPLATLAMPWCTLLLPKTLKGEKSKQTCATPICQRRGKHIASKATQGNALFLIRLLIPWHCHKIQFEGFMTSLLALRNVSAGRLFVMAFGTPGPNRSFFP